MTEHQLREEFARVFRLHVRDFHKDLGMLKTANWWLTARRTELTALIDECEKMKENMAYDAPTVDSIITKLRERI